MPSPAPFAAVLVAAGSGSRAGLGQPKQYAALDGKPMVRLAAEGLVRAGADPLVVVVPAGEEARLQELLHGLPGLRFTAGGATRQQSVRNGLENLASETAPSRVLIHDAARPDLPIAVVERLLAALDDAIGAIPVLPVVDSMIVADGGAMGAPARRETLRRVQTPQAFRFSDILAAHRAWQGDADAGDDAQVLAANAGTVTLVEGDEKLRKFTYAADFTPIEAARRTASGPPFRVGTGYDVHRLQQGEELWLCGVEILHTHGLAGHSDADVGLHAIVDAILGAIGAGDIGQHFPPSNPQWRGASSDRFVAHAVTLAANAGYAIGNVDVTLICEAPKIGPHRQAMQARLAAILGIDTSQVNLKATTTEGLGFAGRKEGIAAQAVAMLYRI